MRVTFRPGVCALVLATGVWSPGVTAAQTPSDAARIGTPSSLAARLPVGTTVIVKERSGASVKGTVSTLTPESITLLADRQERTFARSEILEIRKRIPDSSLDGAFIGMGIGFAVPYVVCSSRSDASETAGCAAGAFGLGGVPGFVIGLIADKNRAATELVFQAPGRATLKVAPLVAHCKVGVQGSIAFGQRRKP